LVSNKTPSLKLSPLGTSDIIGHPTRGFSVYGFLAQLSRYGASKSQKVDHVGSRDVIDHVTIGIATYGVYRASAWLAMQSPVSAVVGMSLRLFVCHKLILS